MDARKVQIKLYAEQGLDQSLEAFIPLFHSWIQTDALGEMVFDVADYTHVPRGIGVLLVGHGSDYAVDQGENRPGLLYTRKRDLPEGAPLVRDALGRALKAAQLLNDASIEAPRGFSAKEILFRFPDRLHLSNTDADHTKVVPFIEAALKELIGDRSYTLIREGETREPLTIRATS